MAQAQPRQDCVCGIIFPSKASLQSVLEQMPDHRSVEEGDAPTYVARYSEHIRVALTTLSGGVAATRRRLAPNCKENADILILYPALLTQMLEPSPGSAHAISLCQSFGVGNEIRDPEIDNLVAGLCQSASPENVERILCSSNHSLLAPCTWVQSPLQVDGIVRSDLPQMSILDRHFQGYSLHHVAICTGQAEKVPSTGVPSLDDCLEPNNQIVCNYIRIGVFEILRNIERNEPMKRAIHLAAKITVPESMLSSRDDITPERMLPVPRDDRVLKRNQRIIREFFFQHVQRCLNSPSEIKELALPLIGDDRFAVAESESKRVPDEKPDEVSNEELVYQVFLQWKKAAGRDIDFVPLKDAFEKMGHKELEDLCIMYVCEHSFCFKMHQLSCLCFVE